MPTVSSPIVPKSLSREGQAFHRSFLAMALVGLLGFASSLFAQYGAPVSGYVLAKPAQVPLTAGGKQVGYATLPRGTKVNVFQWDGDGFLVRAAQGDPFKVPQNGLSAPNGCDLDELAQELRTPGTPAVHPVVNIQVDHPILLSRPDSTPVEANLAATVAGIPKDARFTYSWKQVQDVLSPDAARMDKGNRIAFSHPDAAATSVSITGTGVFEVRLTVTDAARAISFSRNAWIRVWNARSTVLRNGVEEPLFAAPGILPPPSVRTLSPDPGPYCHPRLYCTDQDWPEIRSRTEHGKIASLCLKKLQNGLADKLDKTGTAFADLTAALEQYAQAGFQGVAPDLSMGISSKPGEKGPDWSDAQNRFREYCQQLRDAALVAWLDQDPSVPHAKVSAEKQARFRKLAKVTAAVCHILLHASWEEKTGGFRKDYPLFPGGLDDLGGVFADMSPIGLAYDFTASWMTLPERRATRDFLFAQSAGRTTGARVVFFAPGVHGRLQRGWEQNGDFMNIEEEKVLNALVIEGEEPCVSRAVLQAFSELPKPKDHEKSPDFKAYNWIQKVDVDTKGACAGSKPYPEACTWPHARKASVDNLQRAIWFNDDTYVSPWGIEMNREAYYGFSAWGLWPTAIAYARRGAANQYVTGAFYQTVAHLLYSCYQTPHESKSEHYASNYFLFDHHDGGGDYRQTHIILLKYMYPDDPAVDYVYAGNAPQLGFNPFIQTLFGLDPGIQGKTTTLKEVGTLKEPALTKVDPQMGFVVARTGWGEEEMKLDFVEDPRCMGHMHAEEGSFSFFALGRPWSFAPGYHITDSTWQSEVLIQDPRYASDPVTQGYMGEGPNAIPAGSDYKRCFPTPPGKLLEVTETAGRECVAMAGDNTVAYTYSCGEGREETPFGEADFLYPGFFEELVGRRPELAFLSKNKLKLTPNYNPVRYAYRTILFVRGERPYVFILDDINKDDGPRNYRWQMNATTMFGPPSLFTDKEGRKVASDLDVEPGATPTEAVLLHTPLDAAPEGEPGKAGLPRLLVRDLSEAADPKRDPAITVHKQPFENNPAQFIHRAFICRNQVVEPKFKVLLFPFRTGEKLPQTHWNEDQTELTIDLGNGNKDVLTFDRSHSDHRTRVHFSRTR